MQSWRNQTHTVYWQICVRQAKKRWFIFLCSTLSLLLFFFLLSIIFLFFFKLFLSSFFFAARNFVSLSLFRPSHLRLSLRFSVSATLRVTIVAQDSNSDVVHESGPGLYNDCYRSIWMADSWRIFICSWMWSCRVEILVYPQFSDGFCTDLFSVSLDLSYLVFLDLISTPPWALHTLYKLGVRFRQP